MKFFWKIFQQKFEKNFEKIFNFFFEEQLQKSLFLTRPNEKSLGLSMGIFQKGEKETTQSEAVLQKKSWKFFQNFFKNFSGKKL